MPANSLADGHTFEILRLAQIPDPPFDYFGIPLEERREMRRLQKTVSRDALHDFNVSWCELKALRLHWETL